MPNPWWDWAEDLADQVENLEEENRMLKIKVQSLESNAENLTNKLDDLLSLMAGMQPQESSSNKSDNPWNHKLCPLCRKGYYIERSESSTGHGYCTNKKCRRSRENKERKAESIRGRCEIRKCSFDG